MKTTFEVMKFSAVIPEMA